MNVQIKFWVLLLVVVAILVACNPATTPTPVEEDPPQVADQPSAPAEAVFQVIKADGASIPFSAADLKALPLAQVEAEGKVEEGPRLLDILQAAGVSEFEEITLTGADGSMTLSAEQVDDQVILDFTNRGTVKLAAANIPKTEWVKDITRIEVK